MKKLKLYYSISEVAQMFGVSENLLRFWEQQFPTIHPRRAGRDIRTGEAIKIPARTVVRFRAGKALAESAAKGGRKRKAASKKK